MLLKKTSLKGKLLVIILLTSFICVALTTIAITYIGIHNIRDKMVADFNVTAVLTADRAASFINFGNAEEVRETLELFSRGDERLQAITRACVYSQNVLDEVELLTSKIRADNKEKGCPEIGEISSHINKTVFTSNSLKTYKEMKFRGKEVVGYLFLESDLSQINKFVYNQVVTAAIIILAVSLISYFLATTMQHSISEPILHLVDVTRKVSKQRDYSLRANNFLFGDDVSKNEISVLIDAFNSMLAEVEERREMLLKKNQELIKAKDAAESANRAKSQFLANISHELRTPLNAVIGFSDIIMKEMLGPIENKKYLEYSQDINDSGEHLLHVINDILDLSKAEAGKLEPVLREISVRKTIDECFGIIGERVEKSSISLTSNIASNLPPLIADRVMFKRILLHLLSNAIKFTNTGGVITITADAVKGAEGQGDIFTIEVRDTGIGMGSSDIELAFKSFTQLDAGLSRKYDGTGLGLPLSKKFMDLHGGKIELQSEVGKGTVAILTFYSKR